MCEVEAKLCGQIPYHKVAGDDEKVHGTAALWSASTSVRWRVVRVLGLLFGQGLEWGVSHIRARTKRSFLMPRSLW